MGSIRARRVLDALSRLVPSRPEYGRQSYWDKTYKSALFPFEWAGLTFEDLVEYRYTTQEQPAASRGALEHDVPKDAPALLLGTGTSLFPEAMAEAGWGDLTSIDFAASVVGPRREAAEEHLLGVRWLETDARRMDAFASCTFASALDKGLLDGSYLGGPPQVQREPPHCSIPSHIVIVVLPIASNDVPSPHRVRHSSHPIPAHPGHLDPFQTISFHVHPILISPQCAPSDPTPARHGRGCERDRAGLASGRSPPHDVLLLAAFLPPAVAGDWIPLSPLCAFFHMRLNPAIRSVLTIVRRPGRSGRRLSVGAWTRYTCTGCVSLRCHIHDE